MKIRTNFVTNSSSSSFIVNVGVRLKDGKVIKYEAFAEDDGGGVDYGEIMVDGNIFNRVAEADSLNDLITILEQSVSYNYADEDEFVTSDHRFDPKDFELYKGIRKKSYTRDDYYEAEFGFKETNDDLDDGRSVPFSKGIVIFDKEIRKKASDLDDIQSVIVESTCTASGEFFERDKFPGLDWDESGNEAVCVSTREMDLKTQEIKKETKSKWD